MRKRILGRKLSRDRGSRAALFRALVRSLVLSGSIVTTRARAKAVQPDIEKLITLVASGDLASKRSVLARLANDRKTLELLVARYLSFKDVRKSGFTRIISMPPRKGDNAPMARLEWTENVQVKEEIKEVKTVEKKKK
ncbi:50S ribosomal protein L17 [Candidatus Microgenomates bacterium]|nr:MAG: 50S ribosomal protein L17 [Candidatus Microgenomates bacterium]